MRGAVFSDAKNQAVIQSTGHLHNCAATGTAAENGNTVLFASGNIHFGRDFVGVADDDESFRRFPEHQRLVARAGLAPVEQGLVRREVFGGRLRRQVEAFHFLRFDFAGDTETDSV